MPSGKVYISDTVNTGKGMFTRVPISQNEIISKFEGDLFTCQEILKIGKDFLDCCLQIDNDLYMKQKTLDFINHSCNPNCWIQIKGQRAFLVAFREIQKGEELTFDYSTTMDEDYWEMDCNCQSINCRKRIRDFKYLPEEIQENYIQKGIIPKYILEKLKHKSKIEIEID